MFYFSLKATSDKITHYFYLQVISEKLLPQCKMSKKEHGTVHYIDKAALECTRQVHILQKL